MPVCLLLYGADELSRMKQGVVVDASLRDFLKQEGIVVVDAGDFIQRALPRETTFRRITVPDGHLNREGDRLVAESLVEALKRIGLL